MDSRTFAGIEHAELNAGLIGIDTHFPAQSVQFPHEMAFGRAADRRIAGHHGDIVHGKGRKQGMTANAGCRQCRFNARMTCPDYDYIIHPGNKYIFIFHFPYLLIYQYRTWRKSHL